MLDVWERPLAAHREWVLGIPAPDRLSLTREAFFWLKIWSVYCTWLISLNATVDHLDLYSLTRGEMFLRRFSTKKKNCYKNLLTILKMDSNTEYIHWLDTTNIKPNIFITINKGNTQMHLAKMSANTKEQIYLTAELILNSEQTHTTSNLGEFIVYIFLRAHFPKNRALNWTFIMQWCHVFWHANDLYIPQ